METLANLAILTASAVFSVLIALSVAHLALRFAVTVLERLLNTEAIQGVEFEVEFVPGGSPGDLGRLAPNGRCEPTSLGDLHHRPEPAR